MAKVTECFEGQASIIYKGNSCSEPVTREYSLKQTRNPSMKLKNGTQRYRTCFKLSCALNL